MNTNEYLVASARTVKHFDEGKLLDRETIDLLHAAIGMVTESGEFIDALKKNIFYDKPLDIVNLKEELGDLLWYVALAIRILGEDFEQIMETNINKLKARYPEEFTEHHALNRDLNKEREILENENIREY